MNASDTESLIKKSNIIDCVRELELIIQDNKSNLSEYSISKSKELLRKIEENATKGSLNAKC